MVSRDRRCHHLLPSAAVEMPSPRELVRLGPVMKILMDAAGEYDSIDPEPTPIVEWVRWLDVEVRSAVAQAHQGLTVEPLRQHDMSISR